MSAALIVLPSRPKILLMRQDRIGDVFVATPVFHALRAKYPEAQIDVLLSRNNIAAAFALRDVVDTTHILQKNSLSMLGLLWKLRRERYDLLIDLNHTASSTSNILITSAKATRSVVLESSRPSPATHVVPQGDRSRRHIVDVLCDLLLPLGIAISERERHLRVPISQEIRDYIHTELRGDDTGCILGVQISGSSEERMYPVESWKDVLQSIKSKYPDLSIVILSAPKDQHIGIALAEHIGGRYVSPGKTYEHFAAAIAECDCLVSPDTAAIHIAAAHNVPSVVLFSKDPRGYLNWLPYGSTCWPIITVDPSLSAIAASEVVDNLRAMLRG